MPVAPALPGLRRIILVLAAWSMLQYAAQASHILGSHITYTCQGNNRYLIVLDLYQDCAGAPVVPQTLSIASDCGTSYVISQLPPVSQEEAGPLCPGAAGSSTCNGGALPGVMHYRFELPLTLPPCARWVLSWNFCCHATGVNTGPQGIYVETVLSNLNGSCDSSPVFGQATIPFVCVNEPTYLNLNATDPDGDSLAFALVSGRYANAGDIYPIDYESGYSGEAPVPGIAFDPSTGHMVFTAWVAGPYTFNLKISSFTRDGQLKGTLIRDLIVFVKPCNSPPFQPAAAEGLSDLTGGGSPGPFSIATCTGSTVCFDAVFSHPDPQERSGLTSNITSVLPGAEISVTGDNPVTAHICWDASGASLRDHAFIIAVNDSACPIIHRQQFTYHLRVVPPIDAGPDRIICPNEDAGLAASGGTLQWTSVSGDTLIVGVNFSCDTCAAPIASPAMTTVYRATGTGGCTDDVTVTVLPATDPACIGSGLTEQVRRLFSVSPNPASGLLRIEGVDGRSFEVLDMQGRMHAQGAWTGVGPRTIALPEQLGAGAYMLRVRTVDGELRTARFLVAR
ncbi:MAG: T9SS type A sorting domain-containing protein [Flavobacteriales bacterium]